MCLSKQKIHFPQVCPECERPAVDGTVHPGCKKKYSLDGLTSLFVYEGAVKEAIKRLKYNFAARVAEILIQASISQLEKQKLPKFENLVLVPIPLYPTRKRWRGFNQASILGKLVAKKQGFGFEERLLLRARNTKPQMELKGEERMENIKGAFSVSPNILVSLPAGNQANILLFDDVWTTGATLREAGRVLKKAGANFVWALTIAR